MSKVLIYRFGDTLEVFANAKVANDWFEKNDPEGVAFEYDVISGPAAKDAISDIRADLAAMQPQVSDSDEAVRQLRSFVPSEDQYLVGENPPSHVISAWNFLAKYDACHRQPAHDAGEVEALDIEAIFKEWLQASTAYYDANGEDAKLPNGDWEGFPDIQGLADVLKQRLARATNTKQGG